MSNSPLDYPCSKCGAKKKEPCDTLRGTRFHLVRLAYVDTEEWSWVTAEGMRTPTPGGTRPLPGSVAEKQGLLMGAHLEHRTVGAWRRVESDE